MFSNPPGVYSFVCKPRILKFGTQLKSVKSTIEINIELDMINYDVSMTSYLILSMISLKLDHFLL